MASARVIAAQVRAARASLGWTIAQLSEASGVSTRTLKYFEDENSDKAPRETTLEKIVVALTAAGIEFIGTPEDGPGIRLRRPTTVNQDKTL